MCDHLQQLLQCLSPKLRSVTHPSDTRHVVTHMFASHRVQSTLATWLHTCSHRTKHTSGNRCVVAHTLRQHTLTSDNRDMRAHILIDSFINNGVRSVFAKLKVRTVRHTAKHTDSKFDSLSVAISITIIVISSHVVGAIVMLHQGLSQVLAISIRNDLACRVEVARQYTGNLAGYALVKMCLLMCETRHQRIS